MVYRQIDKSKTLTSRKTNSWAAVGMLTVLMTTMVLCVCTFCFGDIDNQVIDDEIITVTNEDNSHKSSNDEVVQLEKIDFQPVIDEWVNEIGGNKGVAIYDLDLGEMVGTYDANEQYNTASLYKLFVVYEGYRRVESGKWSADDLAGATGYTIAECLDLAIRESYSPCAEVLWDKIGVDALDEIVVNSFGIKDSIISDFVTTPEDIVQIMRIFYKHVDICDESMLAQMKDSFLNQPETEHDWRQGLPSGFSDVVAVYNKVGWEYNENIGRWDIYNDAAIVDFLDQNRHFVVVVMSNDVPYQKIRDFGTMLEEHFYKSI